jgi:type I restriction enzyme, S subunit
VRWERPPRILLRDLIEIKHGFAFKGAYFMRSPGQIVLTPGNFRETGGLKFRSDKDRSYSGPYPAEFRLKPNDLLVVMTDLTQNAPILGAAAFIPDGITLLHNQRLGKVSVLDPKRLNRRFLYYVFNSPEFRSAVKSSASGATVRHTSPSRIYDIHIALPSMVQHRIASISTDELGPIPDGWRRCELREVASVNRQSIKPIKAPTTIRYVDITSVSPDSIDDATEIAFSEAPGRARRQVTDGSIIWSTVRPNRRSHALVLDPPSNMIVSTGFAVVDATAAPFSFLYEAVTTDFFVGYLTNHATGSAYPAVTGETFERALLLVPPKKLLDAFHHHAEPLLRLADKLRRANRQLAAARDLLLPRLVSGELSIAAAEREIEQAA